MTTDDDVVIVSVPHSSVTYTGASLFRRHWITVIAGKVSFGEFLVSLNVATHGNAEDKLRWAFRMYDVDRSGTISLAEVTDILKVLSSPSFRSFISKKVQKHETVTKGKKTTQTRKTWQHTANTLARNSTHWLGLLLPWGMFTPILFFLLLCSLVKGLRGQTDGLTGTARNAAYRTAARCRSLHCKVNTRSRRLFRHWIPLVSRTIPVIGFA